MAMDKLSNYAQQPTSALSEIVKDVQANEKASNAAEVAEMQDNLQDAQAAEEKDPNNAFIQLSKKNDKLRPQVKNVEKAKEKAEARTKIKSKAETNEFLNQNPRFQQLPELRNLPDKLNDNSTKEEIFKLVHGQYKDLKDIALALEFLVGVTTDDLQGRIQSVLEDVRGQLHIEEQQTREKEYSEKVLNQSKQDLTAESIAITQKSAGGTRAEQVRDLHDNLVSNSYETTAIFNLLDTNYSDFKEISNQLVHVSGEDIKKLKDVSTPEAKAQLRNTIDLKRKVVAGTFVVKAFENMNR